MTQPNDFRVHFRFADHELANGPDLLLSELDDIGGDDLIKEADGSYTIISRNKARAESVKEFLLHEQGKGRIKLLK